MTTVCHIIKLHIYLTGEYGTRARKLFRIPQASLQRLESLDDIRVGYQDVAVLAKFYNVSTDYLFSVTDNHQYRNIEVDKLHLSDDAISVLSSGNVNNRLISEFLSHHDFPQLLSPMEIYIDRKISPQVGAMNGLYQLAESTIREKFKVADNDEILATLQEAIVDKDEYLRYRTSERFNIVMKSLFDAHKKDTLTVEQESVVKELKEDIQVYFDNNDAPMRGKLALFCKKLGLNISKLSDEQIKVLMSALESSEPYKRSVKPRK